MSSTVKSNGISRFPSDSDRYSSSSLIHVTPLLFGWLSITQALFKTQLDSTLFIYMNYISIVLLGLVVFDLLMRTLSTVDTVTRTVAISLVLFMLGYPVGIFSAEYVPSVNLIRTELVSNFTVIFYALILMLAPRNLRNLRRNFEYVFMVVAFLTAIDLIIALWQTGGIGYDRAGGIFEQAGVSSAWLSASLAILLFRNKKLPIPHLATISLSIIISIAVLSTGTLFGIILMILFWQLYIFDNIEKTRSKGARLYITIFIIVGLFIGWEILSSRDQSYEDVINYRVSNLLNLARTGDPTYLLSDSSLQVRWALTLTGLGEIPNTLVQGRGLNRGFVVVEIEQNNQSRLVRTKPHNSIILLWLTTGIFPVIPYVVFAISLITLLRKRLAEIGRKRWGNSLGFAILLTLFSTTSPFGTSFLPILIVSLCLATNILDRAKADHALLGF